MAIKYWIKLVHVWINHSQLQVGNGMMEIALDFYQMMMELIINYNVLNALNIVTYSSSEDVQN